MRNVIHEEMGRGHSNHNEAGHNVLIRYRSKDVALNHLHYIVSTNIGLVQSNVTCLLQKYGMEYHWLFELYKKLNLPVFEGMAREISKSTKQRITDLATKQTEEYKNRRMNYTVSYQTVYDQFIQVFSHSCLHLAKRPMWSVCVCCFPLLSTITWKFVSVILVPLWKILNFSTKKHETGYLVYGCNRSTTHV